MTSTPERAQFPILGVVAHNYLRETGLLRMRQDVRIAFIGPPDSPLHRIADYSCPLRSLDVSEAELRSVITSAANRSINLDGLISMRDPNVPDVAAIARDLWPERSPAAEGIARVASKFWFRRWLNEESGINEKVLAKVPYEGLPHEIDEESFRAKLIGLLRHGPIIVKPECGSCSYYIIRVPAVKDVSAAWQQFRLASEYRKGNFVAEQEVFGAEMAVETVIDSRVRHVAITPYFSPDPDMFYEVGHYVPDTLTSELRDKIQRVSHVIHDALPLRHIVTHMEIKVAHDGTVAVIELNPRLAGDLTPELHFLTTGIDYYRIAAHIATSREPVPSALLTTVGRHRNAIIRFHPPVAGRLRQTHDVNRYFQTADDRFGLCHPRGSVLTGGTTNDDRSAYILLAGDDQSELIVRSNAALEDCLTVDRASFIITPV